VHEDLSRAPEEDDVSRSSARSAVQWMRLRGVALLGLGILIYWWVRLQVG
jgi:hypothetical protein